MSKRETAQPASNRLQTVTKAIIGLIAAGAIVAFTLIFGLKSAQAADSSASVNVESEVTVTTDEEPLPEAGKSASAADHLLFLFGNKEAGARVAAEVQADLADRAAVLAEREAAATKAEEHVAELRNELSVNADALLSDRQEFQRQRDALMKCVIQATEPAAKENAK